MILVPAERLDGVRTHLADAGYAVVEATTPVHADLRGAQAELAAALGLPSPAEYSPLTSRCSPKICPLPPPRVVSKTYGLKYIY